MTRKSVSTGSLGFGSPVARAERLLTTAVIAGVALLAGAVVAPAQDAAAVDPDHYTVAFENEQVRVLKIHFGPNEKSVMHAHPAGVVVFLDDLSGRFTMPDGSTLDRDVTAGTVQWVDASTHQPENLGSEPFDVVQIELKGAGDRASDEAAIRASAPAWAAAFNAGDAETIAGMYWEDSLTFPPNVPAVPGGETLREFFAAETSGFRGAGLTMHIPEAGAVRVVGDLAYEAGTYSVTDAGGATVDTGKYIGVFEKRDGVWRYIRDTWNSDLAPPASGD